MAKKSDAKKSTPTSTTKLTPATILEKLRTGYRSMKQKIDGARGTYGQMVANAEEEKHLHKRAWAQAMREDKMEPEDLLNFYEHLDHYRDKLGLNKRAESAPAMNFEEAGPDEGEADENSNVTPLPDRQPATAH